jgi:hypothetical protein
MTCGLPYDVPYELLVDSEKGKFKLPRFKEIARAIDNW